jgi:hypothetical protein
MVSKVIDVNFSIYISYLTTAQARCTLLRIPMQIITMLSIEFLTPRNDEILDDRRIIAY